MAAAIIYLPHSSAPVAPRASIATAAPAAEPTPVHVVEPVAEPPRPVAEPPQPVTAPAPAPVRAAPAAKPVRAVRHSSAPAEDKQHTKLLQEYQRIGHDLIALRERRGNEDTADLWQQFKSLQLDRAEAEAELRALREQIERRKGVDVSSDCENNPLAEGCR
jgi:hypothetical protein